MNIRNNIRIFKYSIIKTLLMTNYSINIKSKCN